MHYKTIEEVAALVRDFEEQKVAHEAWDHLAHLAVCTWFVMKDSENAERRMRDGLLKLNRALGIISTPASGYHETLTLFWLAKVESLVDVCDGSDLAVLNAVTEGLADPNLVLFHYSPERIASTKARMDWTPPDLVALPTDDPGQWHMLRRVAG